MVDSRRRARLLPTSLLLLAAALSLAPLQGLPQETDPATIFADEVSVGYVLVPVVVRAGAGYVKNLDEDDFRLLVDGKRIEIASFERRAEAPASLIVLQDLSGSMANGGKLEASRAAVRFFLERSRPGDELALATFGGGMMQVDVPFTAKLDAIGEAVASWEAYGTTALHDAVAWIPQISTGNRNPKRFALLITDGVDNASTMTPQDARRLVREAQLPVYVLGMSSGNPFEVTAEGEKVYRYADVLNLLAHESGGRYLPVESPEQLEEALAEISDDLRHQYVLGFETGDGAVQYRDIDVRVAGRHRAILYRQGYKGTPPATSAGG